MADLQSICQAICTKTEPSCFHYFPIKDDKIICRKAGLRTGITLLHCVTEWGTLPVRVEISRITDPGIKSLMCETSFMMNLFIFLKRGREDIQQPWLVDSESFLGSCVKTQCIWFTRLEHRHVIWSKPDEWHLASSMLIRLVHCNCFHSSVIFITECWADIYTTLDEILLCTKGVYVDTSASCSEVCSVALWGTMYLFRVFSISECLSASLARQPLRKEPLQAAGSESCLLIQVRSVANMFIPAFSARLHYPLMFIVIWNVEKIM